MFKTILISCLAGAVVSGGVVYAVMKPTVTAPVLPDITLVGTSSQPVACAFMVDETTIDNQAILERIIVWSDMVSPWFVKQTNADITAEGEAVRADGVRARELYRELIGRDYTVPDASKKYGFDFMPKDNPFANASEYVHTSIFASMIAVAGNEVYAAAGYSQDARVAEFTNAFKKRTANYAQPGDVVVPGTESVAQPVPVTQ